MKTGYRVAWLCVAAVLFIGTSTAQADDPGWPREIDLPEGRVVLFQPQLEEFSGNGIAGRMALSITPPGRSTPIFGVVWLDALVEVDRDARTAVVYNISVDRVQFPDDVDAEQLDEVMERELPTWELELSLDRLLTALDSVEGAREQAAELATAPPAIEFRNEPSVLVTIDGDPISEELEGTALSRVVNTPFLMIRDADSQAYFLYAGTDAWYTARSVTGEWTYTTEVPDAVAEMAPDASDVELPDPDEAANAGVTPAIVVATEPTELLFTNGDPQYTALSDGRLMYVNNTDSTLIMEIDTQRHFTVLSGRWFASPSLEGPWSFIESEDLPEAFREIPEDANIADIRVHIAGTDEAAEAVLDARIPQTAVVERGPVDLSVVFDGEPQFEDIPGTSIRWAVNTDRQLLAAEGQYWLIDDAVWYVADAPAGPWEVAVERPDEVDQIPPDNPNYNVKYAEIYAATPEVVYVGYTPGYTHTYVHHVTVVHGTGFHYPHWHSTMFIPRHSTWGFHVRFSPWWGWSSGIVFSNGRFTFGIGFHPWSPWHRGWWGPMPMHVHWRGFHRGFYSGWHRGFSAGARAGFRAGARAGYQRANLFRTQGRTGARIRSAAPRQGPVNRDRVAQLNSPGGVSRTQANNVLSDRNGNVLRSDRSGQIQQRQNGQWTRPTGPSNNRTVQRTQQMRQRGTQRANNARGARGGGGGGARARRR